MRAAISNIIRGVQHQRMLKNVVETQRKRFYERITAALNCTSPVPLFIEQHLAGLILRSRRNQSSVLFLKHTYTMEETVCSRTYAAVRRLVIFTA